MTYPPIKRSEQLAPLSRDHHEGLLLSWKIKQGLKNGADLQTIQEFIKWFWQNHLEEHFREEEETLAPCLSKENELIRRMFEEHQTIKKFVNSDEAPNAISLTQFADLLNDHIRFEERVLFPFIEKTVSVEELQSIYEQLEKDHKDCGVWANEFWKS